MPQLPNEHVPACHAADVPRTSERRRSSQSLSRADGDCSSVETAPHGAPIAAGAGTRGWRVAALVLAAADPLAAQTYILPGSDCSSSAGIPALHACDPPALCRILQIDLTQVPAGSSCVRPFGVQQIAMPIDLGFIGSPGCPVDTLPDPTSMMTPATDGARAHPHQAQLRRVTATRTETSVSALCFSNHFLASSSPPTGHSSGAIEVIGSLNSMTNDSGAPGGNDRFCSCSR